LQQLFSLAGEMMQQGWVLLDIRPPGETSSLLWLQHVI
jgi:hypothetical protein